MASVISAGTTSGTSLNLTGDTSGQLQLQTNGTTPALTINTSQSVGIGVTSVPEALTVKPNGTGANLGLNLVNNASNLSGILFSTNAAPSTSYTYIKGDGRSSGFITLTTNDTERMRLDASGNLGIGTSSPTTKLQVTGGVYSDNNLNNNFLMNSSGSYYGTIQNDAADRWSLGYTAASGTLGTSVLTWNGSGNLGLGVTPSAWGGGFKSMELGSVGNAIWGTVTSDMYVMSGVYYNSGFKYAVSSKPVSMYEQASGQHMWSVAGSGTAGNAITFTQSMTLDASGNLGVGNTAPGSYGKFMVDPSGNGTKYSILGNTTGTIGIQTFGSYSVAHLRLTYPSVVDWDNLVTSGGALTWGNGSERMRINSSGQVMINTTSTSGFVTDGGKFYIRNSGECMSLYNDTGSGWNLRFNATSNGGNFYYQSFAAAGTGVGSITSNSTTTTYATSSDYRLKENIAPMTGALDTVAQLKPCTYTWKLNGSQGQGFIAHELAEVIPDAVIGEKDALEEDGSIKPQGIDTSFLVATLTAAIQELNAKVDAQAAEIATLKGTK